MDVRKCGRMEAKYVHTSIRPNFHPRTELAEFVSYSVGATCRGSPAGRIGAGIHLEISSLAQHCRQRPLGGTPVLVTDLPTCVVDVQGRVSQPFNRSFSDGRSCPMPVHLMNGAGA